MPINEGSNLGKDLKNFFNCTIIQKVKQNFCVLLKLTKPNFLNVNFDP